MKKSISLVLAITTGYIGLAACWMEVTELCPPTYVATTSNCEGKTIQVTCRRQSGEKGMYKKAAPYDGGTAYTWAATYLANSPCWYNCSFMCNGKKKTIVTYQLWPDIAVDRNYPVDCNTWF